MKERLVGAAVLVALGVWLIPWILDGHEPPAEPAADVEDTFALPAADEPARTQTRTIALTDAERNADAPDASAGDAGAAPAEADRDTAAAVAPAERGTHAESAASGPPVETPAAASVAEAASPAQDPAPSEPEPAAAAPAAAPVEDGWFVQLGSFGDVDNARRLAARVATFGYEADVSPYRSGGRTLNRVRVGPSATRDEASAVASSLAAHGFVAQVVSAD